MSCATFAQLAAPPKSNTPTDVVCVSLSTPVSLARAIFHARNLVAPIGVFCFFPANVSPRPHTHSCGLLSHARGQLAACHRAIVYSGMVRLRGSRRGFTPRPPPISSTYLSSLRQKPKIMFPDKNCMVMKWVGMRGGNAGGRWWPCTAHQGVSSALLCRISSARDGPDDRLATLETLEETTTAGRPAGPQVVRSEKVGFLEWRGRVAADYLSKLLLKAGDVEKNPGPESGVVVAVELQRRRPGMSVNMETPQAPAKKLCIIHQAVSDGDEHFVSPQSHASWLTLLEAPKSGTMSPF
ncbi:hypothetical protein GWK47_050814 [Chionoecetes opilio]|uniref:Uncharacterized protein n=1 Tax=Chionoecetes opilio TaxID=41210 RepID=A0A8J4Y1B0_CHIOP|nr:hypothetical protein GWK47_050814 [Chionoecetes opilio]